MPAKRRRSREADQHHFRHADFMRFWHVCENAACRRACACRGDTRTCSGRNFKRLPHDMQSWHACFLMGKEEGLPFEETMARLAETRVANAYDDWCAQVAAHGAEPARLRSAPPCMAVMETAQARADTRPDRRGDERRRDGAMTPSY